jgi:hypothetical protein
MLLCAEVAGSEPLQIGFIECAEFHQVGLWGSL